MAAAGSFLSGLSSGLGAGLDMRDRKADRESRERELQAAEARAARPEQEYPAYAPPPQFTRGAVPQDMQAQQPQSEQTPSRFGPTRQNALFGLIDKHEGAGRYDTLFGHSQRNGAFKGVDVSRMTLGQLREFSNTSGRYGKWVKEQLAASGQTPRIATPMGRHQIVGTTLRTAAKQMGLSDDTVFSPQVQDDIAMHLARQRLSNATTMQGKMRELRTEWEGFKHVSDADLARAIREMEQ